MSFKLLSDLNKYGNVANEYVNRKEPRSTSFDLDTMVPKILIESVANKVLKLCDTGICPKNELKMKEVSLMVFNKTHKARNMTVGKKKKVADLVIKSIFENSEDACGLSLQDLTVEQKEQIKDYAAHLVAERGVDGWEALGLALEDVASIDQCEPQQVFSQDDALHVEMMAKQIQIPIMQLINHINL